MDFLNAQPSTSTAIEHDRRRYPRQTVQVQAEIHQEGSDIPLRLETTDLSRGGCYIQLMMPLPVDGRVQIKLWLDGQPMVIRGRVVTRHPTIRQWHHVRRFRRPGRSASEPIRRRHRHLAKL